MIREDHSTLGGVSIEDRSTNGTFVSERRLLRGKRVPLPNNAVIGMAFAKAANFVFISGSVEAHKSKYPRELRLKYAVSVELDKGACGVVM